MGMPLTPVGLLCTRAPSPTKVVPAITASSSSNRSLGNTIEDAASPSVSRIISKSPVRHPVTVGTATASAPSRPPHSTKVTVQLSSGESLQAPTQSSPGRVLGAAAPPSADTGLQRTGTEHGSAFNFNVDEILAEECRRPAASIANAQEYSQKELLHWHHVMQNYVRSMAASAVQWVLRSLLCAWSAKAKQLVRNRQELADAFAITSVVSRLVVFAWRRLVDGAASTLATSRTARQLVNAAMRQATITIANELQAQSHSQDYSDQGSLAEDLIQVPAPLNRAVKPRSELHFARRAQDLLCLSAPFHAWHRAVLCAALVHAADSYLHATDSEAH